MSGKNVNFSNKKTKKSDLQKLKGIKVDDIDINNILVSKEGPYCTKNSLKYFIGCNDNNVIRPLRVRFSQMTGYAKKFEFEQCLLRLATKNC